MPKDTSVRSSSSVACPYGMHHTVEVEAFGYHCHPPPACSKPCTLSQEIEEEEEEEGCIQLVTRVDHVCKCNGNGMRSREEVEKAVRNLEASERYSTDDDLEQGAQVDALMWVLKQDKDTGAYLRIYIPEEDVDPADTDEEIEED